MGFLADPETPVIWRGPMLHSAIRQFFEDVAWGDLDYLLVDVPPGTDKMGRFLDLVPDPDHTLLVTIPSKAAISVVSRAATLLREADVRSVGIVGNMMGYAASEGGATMPLFSQGGVAELARTAGFEVWAEVPFDPRFGALTDAGTPPAEQGGGAIGPAFEALASRLERPAEVSP